MSGSGKQRKASKNVKIGTEGAPESDTVRGRGQDPGPDPDPGAPGNSVPTDPTKTGPRSGATGEIEAGTGTGTGAAATVAEKRAIMRKIVPRSKTSQKRQEQQDPRCRRVCPWTNSH